MIASSSWLRDHRMMPEERSREYGIPFLTVLQREAAIRRKNNTKLGIGLISAMISASDHPTYNVHICCFEPICVVGNTGIRNLLAFL
jgi:hypothetical protein